MGKRFHHLTFDQRRQLEILQRAKHSPKEITALLNVHVSTIYRELRRGKYTRLDTDYRQVDAYSPECAQMDYDYKATAKGAPIKLGSNYALEQDIETLILEKQYSPAATAATLRDNPQHGTLCEATIYRYAKQGFFSRVTPKDFPEHGKRKHPYQKVITQKKNKTKLGTSIEERPKEIAERTTFGNWEMDCVEGKQGTKGVLLALTERLHCTELVIKIPNQTAQSVVNALDGLEKICGKQVFKKLFKTITMDNGHEFADSPRIEKGPKNKQRTTCYYCHPQAPTERANNERQNKFIRRRYPKGQPLTKVTQNDCTTLSGWINTYPVESLDWKTPAQCFIEACQKEGIKLNSKFMEFFTDPYPVPK